jgi:hypothetical protein
MTDVEPIAPELGAVVPHPPTFRVSDLPAALFPSLIVVYCDRCGVEREEDVIVHMSDGQATRFGYLRAHLSRREGWRCDDSGDLCPDCREVERRAARHDG